MTDRKRYILYLLEESDTAAVRYIGYTAQQPKERLRNHHRGRCSQAVRQWIRELEARGAAPQMQVIAQFESQEEADKAEKYYIGRALRIGIQLLNMVLF